MGYGSNWGNEPNGSPPAMNVERAEENWGEFDSSVNAVSFGFVATAILISMFLIMAIFERFLRPSLPHNISSNTNTNTNQTHIRSHIGFSPKLGHPSPKIVYSEDVSVLMPGDDIPTFIAQPVPLPCPPDRIQWPPPPNHT